MPAIVLVQLYFRTLEEGRKKQPLHDFVLFCFCQWKQNKNEESCRNREEADQQIHLNPGLN